MFEYFDHYGGKQIEFDGQPCHIVKSLGNNLFFVVKDNEPGDCGNFRPVYLVHWIDQEMKDAEKRAKEILSQP